MKPLTIQAILSLLFVCSLYSKPFHVVIDPGHGGTLVKGKNDGSQGSHGASHNNAKVTLKDGSLVLEKDIVLEYAKALKQELEKFKEIEVTLTRSPRAYVVADDHFAWQYTHFVNPYIKRDIVLANHIVKSLEIAFKPFGGKASKNRVFNDTIEPSNDHGLAKGTLIDGIRGIGYARMDTHLFNAAVVLVEVEFLDTKNYSEFLTGENKEKVKNQAARYMASAINDYKKAQVLLEKPVPFRK